MLDRTRSNPWSSDRRKVMLMPRPWRVLLASLLLLAPIAAAQNPEPPPARDPRVGLKAGWWDAAQATWNLRLVSTSRPPAKFIPAQPGDFDYMNSDLAFRGTTLFQGNFQGYSIWDVADPFHPRLINAETCPEQQNDVSV